MQSTEFVVSELVDGKSEVGRNCVSVGWEAPVPRAERREGVVGETGRDRVAHKTRARASPTRSLNVVECDELACSGTDPCSGSCQIARGREPIKHCRAARPRGPHVKKWLHAVAAILA